MISYLDSSVIMRWLLKSEGYYRDFGTWKQGITSSLTEVECSRTLDRLRLEGKIDDTILQKLKQQLAYLLNSIDIIEIDPTVLNLAKGPFTIVIRTLDAIHIASAMLYKDEFAVDIQILTHDERMKLLAKYLEFSVLDLG